MVMTTLDDQLYTWLSETDDRESTLAFNSYFLLAYPALIRHLARFAPSDPALLEEIAQDSLLKFFERIGRGRRAASEAVAGALRQIQPISQGSFHERQVRAWTTDVDSYRRVTMSFRLPRAESDESATWKNTIRELALQIPTLQQQGWHLIDGVRIELQWQEVADQEAAPHLEHLVGAHALTTDAATNGEITAAPATDPATASLVSAVMESAPSAHSAEIRQPGTLQFVYCAVTMIRAIPRLRVPTNGYLFEIAMSLYLDDYRRRRRQKRGGAGSPSAHDAVRTDSDGEPLEHPLENQLADHDLGEEILPEVAAADGWPSTRLRANAECASTDPIRTLEDEEYFERFYAYLRAPVDAAESAYEAARVRGGALAERRKWYSLAQKLSRTMAVLTAIGEGYTQEQAAERLQLSRNKVKYVIETLQDAYARFVARSAGSPHPLPIGGVLSHAP
jgi:DNA-directed RNA polymerase specialized sigma24 family protein